MKKWASVIIISLLFFTTPVYAFSFNDIFSWMGNIFGRVTGYATLLSCPYECCPSNDPTYEEKVCLESRVCKENKCINLTAETIVTTQPSSLITEQVKCIFTDSDAVQKCYTNDGKFGCSGAGTCIADVAGENGTTLVWKSSCPDVGYVETTIDGSGMVKYVAFKCATLAAPYPTATTVVGITEQVKCIFANSNSEQQCFAESFACRGTGTCVVDVSGVKGKMLTWKSTCSGYAYTVIDGKNEYAEFNCQQPTQATTPIATQTGGETIPTPAPTTTQSAQAETTSIQTCVNSDGINYYVKGYVETKVNGIVVQKVYDTCKIIDSNTDRTAPMSVSDITECSGANCYVLEGSCSPSQTTQMAIWKCPSNICRDGVCVKSEGKMLYGEGVEEHVECIFLNSDVLTNSHTATPEKCYTDDGKFGCTWQGGVVTEASGKRYADCMANVSGDTGQKLTWKSSCGDYAYSVIDGNSENVEFTCVPSSNVTSQQISGKGFRYAYLQCLDGQEQKILPPEGVLLCQPAGFYQQRATNFCKDHCNADGSKCGVNSFSISGECYVDVAQAGTAFISSVEATQAPQETQQAQAVAVTVVNAEEAAVICKDSCPSEGKCYPFGYRKGGEYCSDEGAFKEQLKGDSTCENNFECDSNVCVSGKCVSQSFIDMIISWFKKLFGMA
jgi:hypothetical protein